MRAILLALLVAACGSDPSVSVWAVTYHFTAPTGCGIEVGATRLDTITVEGDAAEDDNPATDDVATWVEGTLTLVSSALDYPITDKPDSPRADLVLTRTMREDNGAITGNGWLDLTNSADVHCRQAFDVTGVAQ